MSELTPFQHQQIDQYLSKRYNWPVYDIPIPTKVVIWGALEYGKLDTMPVEIQELLIGFERAGVASALHYIRQAEENDVLRRRVQELENQLSEAGIDNLTDEDEDEQQQQAFVG